MSAIIPFLRDAGFDQSDITAMSIALDDVCKILKLEHDAIARETVAMRIIELARRGERNPLRLRDRLVAEANGEVVLGNGRERVTASLNDLIHLVAGRSDNGMRAAFYLADAEKNQLYHATEMSPGYGRFVDGFAIGANSLACGLAAHTRKAIITRDVKEEPLWQPWLWLAKQFDYRGCWSFPIETSAGKVVGTFAIYHREPREASQHDLDLATVVTRTAAAIISPR